MVKNPPANAGDQETQIGSLGREDPLKKEMATHSSIRAWKILWTDEPGGLLSMRSRSRTRLSTHSTEDRNTKARARNTMDCKWEKLDTNPNLAGFKPIVFTPHQVA